MTFMSNLLIGALLFAWSPVPEAPVREAWTFRRELAEPVVYHANEAYRIIDEYGLEDGAETVKSDLDRFMASAKTPATRTLTVRRGKVDGHESYRIDLAADGNVVLTADDNDGIRRAAYYFEDRVMAGDLRSETRKPWLRNRISRCFFGPIKRPPFNRDELMDDIDYYPDAYLDRLAHEGVNGLWLTVELRNLVKTSFNERDRDAPQRLAKLRRTVEKCSRYGIRTWIFCIEPRRLDPGDPLLEKFPSEAVIRSLWFPDAKILCPESPLVRQYITEAFRDLFEQVPGLPGVINISHGERPTTCLSWTDAVTGARTPCPRCAAKEPWQVHATVASAMVAGMRAVNPQAELLSWFYQPYVEHERAPWVADVARHLPEGVTMLYNFESGAIKNQLGRYRPGGDYWLSYTGPAPAFEKVAEASRQADGLLGAKIQVGCSHECATVPFVPVPGLLYRKYAAMKNARCTSVMQCWYFGNYPGVMNKAAGELAFESFAGDERAFLEKLARPEWGKDAPTLAKFWEDFSDAYAEYPLSNDMQYYGPFHAGVAWPLLPNVEMKPLARTWKPDGPSGDAVGECLENHTLEEAAILADRMRRGTAVRESRDVLGALERKYAADPERVRDLGVVKALRLLFESGADIFEFYRLREAAVCASRLEGNQKRALDLVGRMLAIVANEKRVTEEMLSIARKDSRIGFHSEAEIHQFHPVKLRWRLGELNRASTELTAIGSTLSAGEVYPLSDHERTAPKAACGTETHGRNGFRFTVSFTDEGDLSISGFAPQTAVTLRLFNLCGTAWPYQMTLTADSYSVPNANIVAPPPVVRSYKAERRKDGFTFFLILDARGWSDREIRRPAWIHFSTEEMVLWPANVGKRPVRLNLGDAYPCDYGLIVR